MDILIKTKPDDAVYLFMNKKRTEGKPYYVYMTAGYSGSLEDVYKRQGIHSPNNTFQLINTQG